MYRWSRCTHLVLPSSSFPSRWQWAQLVRDSPMDEERHLAYLVPLHLRTWWLVRLLAPNRRVFRFPGQSRTRPQVLRCVVKKMFCDLIRSLISPCRPPMGRDTCFPRAPTSSLGAHHFPLPRANAGECLLPPFVRIFPWVNTNHIIPLSHSLDTPPSVPTLLPDITIRLGLVLHCERPRSPRLPAPHWIVYRPIWHGYSWYWSPFFAWRTFCPEEDAGGRWTDNYMWRRICQRPIDAGLVINSRSSFFPNCPLAK